MPDTLTPSIVRDAPSTAMDPATTFAHIGRMVLMCCGARERAHSTRGGYVQFKIGNGRRKCIVMLAADDTYSVEVGHVSRARSTWGEWIVDAQERGVYVEDLPAAVRRHADREF